MMKSLENKSACFVGDNHKLRRQIVKLATDNGIYDFSSCYSRVDGKGVRYDYLGVFGGELRKCNGEGDIILSEKDFMEGLKYNGLFLKRQLVFKEQFSSDNKYPSATINVETGRIWAYNLREENLLFCYEEMLRAKKELKKLNKKNNKATVSAKAAK